MIYMTLKSTDTGFHFRMGLSLHTVMMVLAKITTKQPTSPGLKAITDSYLAKHACFTIELHFSWWQPSDEDLLDL